MSYNLTDKQKDLLRWIVNQVRDGSLQEEFYLVCLEEGVFIPSFRGKSPDISLGALDALVHAGLLLCRSGYSGHTETGRTCTLTGKAYEAVDSDFASPSETSAQVNIGAVIHSMSGGNVQATGIAQDAEVSQIVNDPDLLRSHIEALTENLLDEVRSSLKVDELVEYAQAVRELKEQLLAERPDPSATRKLVRTVGLLGDVEGTIELMTRVWVFLYPLLQMAAARGW